MTTSIKAVDNFKEVLRSQHLQTLHNFFWNDKEKTAKFLSSVAYCVQSAPGLLKCDQTSLINAFMKCAEYDIFPSSVSGEAYILPYGSQAQFQLGYKGIIKLLKRAGISIYTDIVKENDEFELSSGFEQNIVHKYPRNSRGKAEWVYAIASYDGEKIIKYMSAEEVLKFKKFSKSAGSDSSPWNPDRDPELNMWRKTAIKQIAKNLPLTKTVNKAIADDNTDGDINAYNERMAIEHATRPSEWKIADLLGTAVTPVPAQKSETAEVVEVTTEAEITEAP